MKRYPLLVTALVACSTASAPALDGRAADGPVASDGPPEGDGPRSDAAAAPYAHTIAIDGSDDFVSHETLSTTSTGYLARVSWDADNLYLGYSGPDLDPTALDTGFKWLFAYLDLDPGSATGATSSLTYNTQSATLPAGFGAELYARWKCDATFTSLEHFDGGDLWSTIATPVSGHAGDFVELAIPRSQFGGSQVIGVVTWMINEKPSFEGSFAGLYAGNFTDSYSMALPITSYLRVDFASPAPPDDPGNRAP